MEHADIENIEAHLSSCSHCHDRYSLLLLLMKRDAPIPHTAAVLKPSLSIDLTERIMKTIRYGKKPVKRYLCRPAFIYAAAAILLFTLGFNFIYLKYGQNPEFDSQVIVFRITVPDATSVTLVGDFTNWKDDRISLSDTDGDGIWETEVSLKHNNIYNYKYLIDEKIWITDPESEFIISDGFGGKNSFIQL